MAARLIAERKSYLGNVEPDARVLDEGEHTHLAEQRSASRLRRFGAAGCDSLPLAASRREFPRTSPLTFTV
jgi:hypothetical protein